MMACAACFKQIRHFYFLSRILATLCLTDIKPRGSQRKVYRFKFGRRHNNSQGCAPTTGIATIPLGLNDI